MKIIKNLFCFFKKRENGTVEINAQKMEKKYPLTKNGYFGTKGENKRIIYSKNQIKDSKKFYAQISKGGTEKVLDNLHGVQKIMNDGGIVTYRAKTSTPNSPAVDLGRMVGKVKNQRIHFIKKEKK